MHCDHFYNLLCVTFEVSSSHGGEYEVHNCLPGSSLMMEAVRTSETSVNNYFTRQYIPEDNSELLYVTFGKNNAIGNTTVSLANSFWEMAVSRTVIDVRSHENYSERNFDRKT
jgi:hypothetical protein